jgi:hypothetical protein
MSWTFRRTVRKTLRQTQEHVSCELISAVPWHLGQRSRETAMYLDRISVSVSICMVHQEKKKAGHRWPGLLLH